MPDDALPQPPAVAPDNPDIPGNSDNPGVSAAPGAAPAAPGDPWLAVSYWAAALCVCVAVATFFWSRQAVAPGEARHGYFVIVCLYALVGAGGVCDAAFRRIPNRFTYPAILLAGCLTMVVAPFCELCGWKEALGWIGCNAAPWGGVAWEALKGFLLCAGVGVLSFAARGLGGGDVKLLAAAGLLAGWQVVVPLLCNALAVALAMGVANLLCRGVLTATVQELLVRLYTLAHDRNFSAPLTFKRNENPFCLSLFIGLALLPWWNCHALVKDWLLRQ